MRTAAGRVGRGALCAALMAGGATSAPALDVVLNAQGEWLDAYFEDGSGTVARRVLVHPDDPALGGRHLNGRLCFFPDAAPEAFRGKFVIADDTYREACVETREPQERCAVTDPADPAYVGTDPDGWGVFHRDATWTGRVIAVEDGWSCTAPVCDASGCTPGDCREPQGAVDPQGCAFDAAANLYGNDVGQGEFGAASGALVVFFAASGYEEHCFLATDLASPGMPVMRDGAIYVPETGGGRITRFTPPFPAGPGDCEPNASGQPVPKTEFTPGREPLVVPGSFTPAGLVPLPPPLGLPAPVNAWYVGSVLAPPSITEVAEVAGVGLVGAPVRPIVAPFAPRNPIGMDVASDGSLWYAELDLSVPDFGTGCGRVSRVRFEQGVPLPPEVLATNLLFPDGVTAIDSTDLEVAWEALPAAPENPPEACAAEE